MFLASITLTQAAAGEVHISKHDASPAPGPELIEAASAWLGQAGHGP